MVAAVNPIQVVGADGVGKGVRAEFQEQFKPDLSMLGEQIHLVRHEAFVSWSYSLTFREKQEPEFSLPIPYRFEQT